MNPTETKLPDKPSALIRVALRDLEACEKDPRYEIEMDYWHQANGVCKVCLAGSVMAKSLGAPPDKSLGSYDFDEDGKLVALDYFRLGWIKDGLYQMTGGPVPTSLRKDRRIASYSDDPADFKRDMNALADELEAQGL